jgi:hypothetical protein
MKLVRAAVLVTAAAVIPLMPTAAHANKYSFADHAGDVLSGPATSDTNPTTLEPGRTNGDIVSSTVQHKRRNIVMRMHFRDIGWNAESNAYLFVIRTSSVKRYVTLYASDGIRGGKAVMTKPNGKKVSCHIGRKIDYTANTASVIVPRSCVSKPRWVKVGMASLFFSGFESGDTAYVDDARTNGTLGSGPALGPKVRR